MLDIFLALGAGALTTLSPCVLPLLPLVLGSALQKSRAAPLLMSVGMILSFASVGALLALGGSAFGLSQSTLRAGAAVIFLLAGVTFLQPRLLALFGRLTQPLAAHANGLISKAERWGAAGFVVMGALLGLVWAPCSGPTLGAAVALAVGKGSVLSAMGPLLLFGVGAAVPLLVVAYGARSLLLHRRSSVLGVGRLGKPVLGVVLVGLGVLTLSGFDKTLEAWATQNLPERWLDLVTRL